MELQIERLSKTYANGVHALRDVSLAIPRGMFGLLGPNGAGKSTLMRILATLQEPDSGSVRLGEIDVLREKDRVRGMLGYLPQEFGLYPKVEALPLLEHFALLKGVGARRERRQVAEALLRQTNLWDARHKKLGGFSGGMRQRFGIAVALIGSPRLIIVDEPTAGLDPAERVRFLNLLSEIGENAVVILSTHIVEDVSELCSRMAIINHGHILLQGEPLAVIARLRGRVWSRVIARAELPQVEAAHTVISTKLLSGRTVVRMVADEHPGEGFDPAEPDLEDVYFSVMHAIPLDAAQSNVVAETADAAPPKASAESSPASSEPGFDGASTGQPTTASVDAGYPSTAPEPEVAPRVEAGGPEAADAASVDAATSSPKANGASAEPPSAESAPEAAVAHDESPAAHGDAEPLTDEPAPPVSSDASAPADVPVSVSTADVPRDGSGESAESVDVVPVEPAPVAESAESPTTSPVDSDAAESTTEPIVADPVPVHVAGIDPPPAVPVVHTDGADSMEETAPSAVERGVETPVVAPPSVDASTRQDDEPHTGLVFDNATLPLFPGTPDEIVDEPHPALGDEDRPEPEEPSGPSEESPDQLGLFGDWGPEAR